MSSTINADTTNGVVITSDTTGEIKLQSAGTDTVTVDTSGNVGIGTSSPSRVLHTVTSGDSFIRIQGGVGNAKGIEMYDGINQPSQIYSVSSDLRFFTNSAERMRIDSNGVVTKPNQPAFMVKSTVGTVTYSGGDVIPFGSFLTQTGSEYSTSNSRFTASVAGNYFFSTLIYFQGTGSLAFNKNGSEVGGVSPLLIAQASGWSGTMSIVIYLAENDYVDVRSRSSSSSTIFGGHSTFQGFLIG